jgi:DNA mismatch repair protein MutS2
MKEFIDPFLYNLPHLDLHGYDRTGAKAMIKMFIDENIRMKEHKIVIIHGKGSGVLKMATHEYLKTDRRVLDYKTNNYNDGETIVIIK